MLSPAPLRKAAGDIKEVVCSSLLAERVQLGGIDPRCLLDHPSTLAQVGKGRDAMHSDVCRTEVAPLHVRIRTKPHGHLPGLGVQVTSQRCLATSCRRDAALEEQHAVGREVGWGAGTDTWREPICRCLDKFKSPGRAAGRHERVRDPSGGGADESEVAVRSGKDQCAVGRQPAQVGTCQLEAGFIGRTLDRISIFPDGRCYVCSYLFDTDLHFATMQDGKVALNKDANEIPPRGRTPSARPRSWPASPSAPTARCCALPT